MISTLPAIDLKDNFELLFRISVTLISLYNYFNQQADNSQISRNKNSINSLTHIAEIQEDHLRQLEIEVANDPFLLLPSTTQIQPSSLSFVMPEC